MPDRRQPQSYQAYIGAGSVGQIIRTSGKWLNPLDTVAIPVEDRYIVTRPELNVFALHQIRQRGADTRTGTASG